MRSYLLQIVLLLSLLSVHGGVAAYSSSQEIQLANDIRQQLRSGEIVELQAEGRIFIGIFQPSTLVNTHGAVIILHDVHQNPDSPAVIRPLRNRLAEHGWATLSLQMPVANADGNGTVFPTLNQAYPGLAQSSMARINAGVAFLEQKNIRNLALVGHGLGANLAASYLAGQPARTFQSLVTISLDNLSIDGFDEVLAQLDLPVLDIYASRDRRPVVDGAGQRRIAIARDARKRITRQAVIDGADHYFSRLEGALVSKVHAWLGKTSPGYNITGRTPGKTAPNRGSAPPAN